MTVDPYAIPPDWAVNYVHDNAAIERRLAPRSVYRVAAGAYKRHVHSRRWPFIWYLQPSIASAHILASEVDRARAYGELIAEAAVTAYDLRQLVAAVVADWVYAKSNTAEEAALEWTVITVLDAAVDEQDRRDAAEGSSNR